MNDIQIAVSSLQRIKAEAMLIESYLSGTVWPNDVIKTKMRAEIIIENAKEIIESMKKIEAIE